MEQRRYPRIQLPLLVELKHPAVGQIRVLARDVSEGGIFVHLPDSHLKPQAMVKLRLLNIMQEENQPTPTVDATVVRCEANGVALQFANAAGKHLWKSVQRVRDELAIGRDYFQVHQSLALTEPKGQLLVVHQHGKWRLPGAYLVVGEDWRTALLASVHRDLGIDRAEFVRTVAVDSTPEIEFPEAAVLQLTHLFRCDAPATTLPRDAPYREVRWLNRPGQADEITFAAERQRRIVRMILDQLRTQSAPE